MAFADVLKEKCFASPVPGKEGWKGVVGLTWWLELLERNRLFRVITEQGVGFGQLPQ